MEVKCANARSSTEAELAGVDDASVLMLWTKLLISRETIVLLLHCKKRWVEWLWQQNLAIIEVLQNWCGSAQRSFCTGSKAKMNVGFKQGAVKEGKGMLCSCNVERDFIEIDLIQGSAI